MFSCGCSGERERSIDTAVRAVPPQRPSIIAKVQGASSPATTPAAISAVAEPIITATTSPSDTEKNQKK